MEIGTHSEGTANMTKKKASAKAAFRKQRKLKRRRPKANKHGDYSVLGARIRELGPQVVLAKAMKVSQQTVSKKLRGQTAVLVDDLELLAKKFKVPMTWFFEDAA